MVDGKGFLGTVQQLGFQTITHVLGDFNGPKEPEGGSEVRLGLSAAGKGGLSRHIRHIHLQIPITLLSDVSAATALHCLTLRVG